MSDELIHGRTLGEWQSRVPVIADLVALRETAWFNPERAPAAEGLADVGLTVVDIDEAAARLKRFAPSSSSPSPRPG